MTDALSTRLRSWARDVDLAGAASDMREAADEIERLRKDIKQAHRHLVNVQPHIANIVPLEQQPFIDTHVDMAMEILSGEHTDE